MGTTILDGRIYRHRVPNHSLCPGDPLYSGVLWRQAPDTCSLVVEHPEAASTARRILEQPFESTGGVPTWSVQRQDTKDTVFQDVVHVLNQGVL